MGCTHGRSWDRCLGVWTRKGRGVVVHWVVSDRVGERSGVERTVLLRPNPRLVPQKLWRSHGNPLGHVQNSSVLSLHHYYSPSTRPTSRGGVVGGLPGGLPSTGTRDAG